MGKAADRQAPPSDAAREAAAELIATAYGDGQLTLEEYQQRLAGVREADNAWRLERWTHDLQAPDPTWQERLRTAAADARQRLGDAVGAAWRAWCGLSRATRAVVVVAMVVLVASMAWLISVTPDGGDESARHLSSGLAELRDAVEDEFDTTEISALQIDPDYARLEVMVETDPPRTQVWAWQDGSFTEVGTPTGSSLGVFDLDDVDVAAVDETLGDALDELGVPDPSEVTTVIRPVAWSDQLRVSLIVRNDYQEEARLVLDFDGDEISRVPFEDPGSS